MNPKGQKNKAAIPGIDIDSFWDCSLEASAKPHQDEPIDFRIVELEKVKPTAVQVAPTENLVTMATREDMVSQSPLSLLSWSSSLKASRVLRSRVCRFPPSTDP